MATGIACIFMYLFIFKNCFFLNLKEKGEWEGRGAAKSERGKEKRKKQQADYEVSKLPGARR